MKYIKGFMEMSGVEWEGHLVAVVFVGGCNFRCPYCHNKSLIPRNAVPDIDYHGVLESLKANQWLLNGVAITGGEPTCHPDIAELCYQLSGVLPVFLETNGSNPDVVEKLLDMDTIAAVGLDIKLPWEDYARVGGDGEPVKHTLELLRERNIPYELRTTIVDDFLSVEDVEKIAKQIGNDSNWYLQIYTENEKPFLELAERLGKSHHVRKP